MLPAGGNASRWQTKGTLAGITFLNGLARMRGIADGWMERLSRDSRIDGEFSPAGQDVQVRRIWVRDRALATTAYPLDRAVALLLMS